MSSYRISSDLLVDLFPHGAYEVVLGGIHGASEHEILPHLKGRQTGRVGEGRRGAKIKFWTVLAYHETHVVARVIEGVLLVNAAAPHPEDVHVGVRRRPQQVGQADERKHYSLPGCGLGSIYFFFFRGGCYNPVTYT